MTTNAKTRLRGMVDPVHSSASGGWIREGGCGGTYWYFRWTDNSGLRPTIDCGASVEFTLVYDDRGRPLAVDVQPIRRAP